MNALDWFFVLVAWFIVACAVAPVLGWSMRRDAPEVSETFVDALPSDCDCDWLDDWPAAWLSDDEIERRFDDLMAECW